MSKKFRDTKVIFMVLDMIFKNEKNTPCHRHTLGDAQAGNPK